MENSKNIQYTLDSMAMLDVFEGQCLSRTKVRDGVSGAEGGGGGGFERELRFSHRYWAVGCGSARPFLCIKTVS
jgi:hypothetical protein